jgi:hypothetical protein
VTDPYRKGKTHRIVQEPYRDGWVVWNWEKAKWDYFNEKLEKLK